MTRRHSALVPLTHDHHHTLAQARRLKEASSQSDTNVLRRCADDFVNFYLGRARHHFHEEEELFFAPLVDHEEAGPLIARAVADHLRVHAMLLEAHVRFEEQDLFPMIEDGLSESELLDLATTGRRDV